MELDPKSPAVSVEIPVSGENRHASKMTDGTQKKIRVRTLNAVGATAVEKHCSHLVVRGFQSQVREGSQLLPQPQNLLLLTDAGEQLLSNGADHGHLELGDQPLKLCNNSFLPIGRTTA